MNLKKLEVIDIDINKIKEYENNAKEHPEWQIKQIAESIRTFGFNDPIAINKDHVIIEGHGRYQAALMLEMEKIPCIVLSEMTEAEERAYIITHNKLTLNTGFDIEILKYELNALKMEEINLDLTGFSEIEIDNIEKKINREKLKLEETFEGKNKEINLEDEEYSKFKHCCPRCSFEFD